MSTLNTPTGSPQCNSAASWKCKYELLEIQCATSKLYLAPSQKGKLWLKYSCLFPDSAHRVCFSSIIDGQISLGQSLCCTVDLFYSVRDFVEEDEEHSGLEDSDGAVDSSKE